MNHLGFDFDPTVCAECGHVHDHHSPLGGRCANTECGSKELKTAVPRQKWAEDAVDMVKSQNAGNFRLGDWLAYGWDNFGEGYIAASGILGFQHPSLKNIVSVCRRVAKSRRRDFPLAFGHHEAVASLVPADQIRFLAIAIEKSLPVAQLRAHVRQTARSEDVQELPDNTETSGLTAWFAAGIRLLRAQDSRTWSPERRQAFREQWTRLSMAAEPLLMGR